MRTQCFCVMIVCAPIMLKLTVYKQGGKAVRAETANSACACVHACVHACVRAWSDVDMCTVLVYLKSMSQMLSECV